MDRAQLLAAMAAAEPKPRPVHVPAWGGTVYVRSLTLAEADEIGEADSKLKVARGLAAVITDEKGQRIFDPSSDADVALIARQSFADLQALFEAVNSANPQSAESVEKLGNGSAPAKS